MGQQRGSMRMDCIEHFPIWQDWIATFAYVSLGIVIGVALGRWLAERRAALSEGRDK